MKKNIIILRSFILCMMMLFAGVGLYAQDLEDSTITETVSDEAEFDMLFHGDLGGYFALSGGGTPLPGEDVGIFGFRMAFLLNHSIILGVNGYGIAPDSRLEDVTGDSFAYNPRMGIEYGGFLLGYHFLPQNLINFSVAVTTGAGELLYDVEIDRDGDDYDDYDPDKFFVVEPELVMHINLWKYVRVGIGGSYRYTKGVERFGVDDKDLSSYNIFAMVEAGCF